MDNIVEEVNVIEKDIENVNEKCNKIQCQPICDALDAVIKLFSDIFKCFKCFKKST
jgi:ribosomal protein L37AE/L43A